MRQSRKKHAVLILLLLLIALVSTGLMTKHSKIEKRSRMTVVFPKNEPEDLSALQDGIRDYAYDHQVKCLVQRTDVSRRTEKADKRRKEK